MTTDVPTDGLRDAARRRLKAKRDLFTMFPVFPIVAVLLVAIWYLTSPGGDFWPIWAILGMALASVFAVVNVYEAGTAAHLRSRCGCRGGPHAGRPPLSDRPAPGCAGSAGSATAGSTGAQGLDGRVRERCRGAGISPWDRMSVAGPTVKLCRGKGIPGMSTLREELAETVAALLDAVPDGPLEDALQSQPEGEVLKVLSLIGKSRRLVDAVGVRYSGNLAGRDDGVDGDPLPVRMGERGLPDVVAREAGVPLATAQQWCTVGGGIAPRRSLLGEALPARHEAVAAAMDAGGLTAEAAVLVLRTVQQLEHLTSGEERDGIEASLVHEASRSTIREFGRLCGALRDRLDPDGIEPREEALRAKAGIRETRTRDGLTRWVMDMHPEAEGVIRTAIDAITAPRRSLRFTDPTDGFDPVEEDDRTLPQKRLDAMMLMAGRYMVSDDGTRAGTKVTMLVTCDYEVLKSKVGRATIFGVDQPISAATARRLASEAEVIPVVMGGQSVVLDVGRANRFFTAAQRLAMAIRDGGCSWPGCETPAHWCEAAHAIDPWTSNGKTDIANGALLCPFHHRRLDRDKWTFEIRDGIPYFIPPPWIDPERTPRRGGRERLPDLAKTSG
jgi:hypothetical protein